MENSILLLMIKNTHKLIRILTITLNNGHENKFQALYQFNRKGRRNLKDQCLSRRLRISLLRHLISSRMKKSLYMSWIALTKIDNRMNKLTLSRIVITIWIQSLSNHEITFKCLIHLENRDLRQLIMQII
jgi:hypothetical protein